jgi:uncharacterized pyridoxal phosphate-containing UPF0001 family protein
MTLSVINSKIKQAEKSAGRDIGSTQLIAVSKVQPNERVLNVLEQGHKVFGENKVQEAHGKWPMFRENFSNSKVHLNRAPSKQQSKTSCSNIRCYPYCGSLEISTKTFK